MIQVSILMLIRDKAKWWLLISGIVFSTTLITLNCGIFCGYMLQTVSLVRDLRADIWVTDPDLIEVNLAKKLKVSDIDKVRSIDGVLSASPLIWNFGVLKSEAGDRYHLVLGVDIYENTVELPPLTSGKWSNLAIPNSIIVDQYSQSQMPAKTHHPHYELNENAVHIVGVCQSTKHFFNYPYIYTNYQNAVKYLGVVGASHNYILVKATKGSDLKCIIEKIQKETGLKAFTAEDLSWKSILWYFNNTGIAASVGSSVIIAFFVGLAICGQTLYSFVLENTRYLSTMKAMGADNKTLTIMIYFQSLTVGLIGCGLGLGLTAIAAVFFKSSGTPPFFLPIHVLILATLTIILITIFSGTIGSRLINKIEPATVFR